MFESAYLSNNTVEVLGTLTVIVISSSLFYYFIVVWTEIVGTLFPKCGCHWYVTSATRTACAHEHFNQLTITPNLCASRFVNGTVSEKDDDVKEEEQGDRVKLDEFGQYEMSEMATMANPLAKGRSKPNQQQYHNNPRNQHTNNYPHHGQ